VSKGGRGVTLLREGIGGVTVLFRLLQLMLLLLRVFLRRLVLLLLEGVELLLEEALLLLELHELVVELWRICSAWSLGCRLVSWKGGLRHLRLRLHRVRCLHLLLLLHRCVFVRLMWLHVLELLEQLLLLLDLLAHLVDLPHLELLLHLLRHRLHRLPHGRGLDGGDGGVLRGICLRKAH